MNNVGRLTGSVAIIPGASSGIGENIARVCAREDATVVVCARGLEKARAVAESITGDGGRALAFPCDVRSDDSVISLRHDVTEAVGAPDVLVNSAGVYSASRFLDTSIDVYRAAMEINYLGTVRVIQAFLPAMVDAGYGRIVNIASTAGKYGSMYQAQYNGSKHAVVGITRSLGLEFAKTGVCINAVCPGFVETPMLDRGLLEYAEAAGVSVEEARRMLLAQIPTGGFVKPEEISPLALHLASRDSVNMTGHSLTVSGGTALI